MNKDKILQIFNAFKTQFKKNGVYRESAALTFVTLLGFIPFIIFLIFFLPELPFLKLENQFSDILISIFLPESAAQISDFIGELANQRIQFNLFSFIILLLTSYSLFRIINDSFDNILNVHEKRKRGVIYNFVKFLGMTIFGSMLILLLLSSTSLSIVSRYVDISFLHNIIISFTPFLILFIIFSLGFAFIPTIRIKSRSIFVGSAVAAFIWIIFRSLFNWYIFNLTNTELIFGYLASIPIFFFWIYSNWIIMLCGVIIVSIMEGRYEISEPKDDSYTMKITVEKLVNGKSLGEFSSTQLKRKELKEMLREMMKDDEKNEFTEKDE